MVLHFTRSWMSRVSTFSRRMSSDKVCSQVFLGLPQRAVFRSSSACHNEPSSGLPRPATTSRLQVFLGLPQRAVFRSSSACHNEPSSLPPNGTNVHAISSMDNASTIQCPFFPHVQAILVCIVSSHAQLPLYLVVFAVKTI